MSEKQSSIKTCPECGNDTFRSARTFYITERFVRGKGGLFDKELVYEKEAEHILTECNNCGKDIDIDELLE